MSTPQKSFIAVDPTSGATYRFNETDWQAKKDRFISKYPNAEVMEYDTYKPEDTQENDNIFVATKNGAYAFSPDEWAEKQERFMAKYPDASVNRVRGVNYWGDKAAEQEQAIKAKREVMQSIPQDATELWGNNPEYLRDLNELEEMEKAYKENPYVKKKAEAEKSGLRKLKEATENDYATFMKEYEDVVRGGGTSVFHSGSEDAMVEGFARSLGAVVRGEDLGRQIEYDMQKPLFDAALQNISDAEDILDKPNQSENNGNAVVNVFKGIGARYGSAEFWSRGMTKLVALNNGGNAAIEKINRKLQAEGETITEDDIDNILTPAEKAYVLSLMEVANAQAQRAPIDVLPDYTNAERKVSRAYQIGEGIAEMTGFIAEFIATGNITNAATSGATKAVQGWLVRNLIAKGGQSLARKAARGLSKVAVNALSKTASAAMKGAVRTAAMGATGGLGGNIATQRTTLQEDGTFKSAYESSLAGTYETAVENFTEEMGPVISDLLGAPFKPFVKPIKDYIKGIDYADFGKLESIARKAGYALGKTSPMAKALAKGGYHGTVEEWGEEFLGSLIRGEMDQFFSKDQQLVLIGTFAPMAVLGMGGSAAHVIRTEKEVKAAAENMRVKLLADGVDEDIVNYLTDFARRTSAEKMSKELSPMLNTLARKSGLGESFYTSDTYKAIARYVKAVAEYQTIDAQYKETEAQQRMDKQAELEEKFGKFYNQADNTVNVVQLKDGKVVYQVTDFANNGEAGAVDMKDGKPLTFRAEDIQATTDKDGKTRNQESGKMSLDAYLSSELVRMKESAEAARMKADRQKQIDALAKNLPKSFELGTTADPFEVVVRESGANGVTVVDAEGNETTLGWEKVGRLMKMPINVLSDRQLAEAEAAEMALRVDAVRAKNAQSKSEQAEVETDINATNEEVQSLQPKPEDKYTDAETGLVDEVTFWTNDPAGYCDWNDRLQNDGGIDSMKQIANAKAAIEGVIKKAEKEAKTDNPVTRKAAEGVLFAAQQQYGKYVALEQKYAEQKTTNEEKRAEEVIAMRERISFWRERLNLGDNLVVLESIEEVKNPVARRAISLGRTEGWYDMKEKKVYLYLPDIASRKILDKKVMHEVVTHYGLDNLLNEQEYAKLTDMVWNIMSDSAKRSFYNYSGVAEIEDATLRRRKAAEEFIAKVAEDITFEKANAESRSIWQRIVDFFKKLFEKDEIDLAAAEIAEVLDKNINGLITGKEQAVEEFKAEAAATQPEISQAEVDKQVETVLNQSGVSLMEDLQENVMAQAETMTDENGDVIPSTTNNGTNLYSTTTALPWVDNLGHEHRGTMEVVLERMQEKGFSEKEIKQMQVKMQTAYDYMIKLQSLTNPDGSVRFEEFNAWAEKTPYYKQIGRNFVKAITSLVSNGDYPINLELTTDCIKREAFTMLLNELVKRGADLAGMGPAEIVTIQKMMKQYGIQVACALCFVEGKRLQIVNWASQIVEDWNAALLEAGVETDEMFEFGKDGDAFIPADEWRTYEDKPKLAKTLRTLDEIAKIFQGLDPETFKEQVKKNKRDLADYEKQKSEAWAIKNNKPASEWKPTKEQEREMKKIKVAGLAPVFVNKNMKAFHETYELMRNEWMEKNPGKDPLLFTPSTKQWQQLETLRNNQIKDVKQKMVRLIMEYPEMRKKMTLNDLLGSKGLMEIRQQHGVAYEQLYSIILQRFGTGTPKPVQDAVPYDGEVMTLTESAFKAANKIGGARLFSFSDFDITKVFDYMQMFFDLEANRQMLQSYTKEVAAVLLFGRSNAKFNISTLASAVVPAEAMEEYNSASEAKKKDLRHQWAENAGLLVDENGNITGISFSEEHSVSPEFAQQIFHDDSRNKDCGAIMVGASVNHAIYSAAQAWIRMVIPFHLSGMPIAARDKTDVKWWTDNTEYQSTRKKTKDGWSKISDKENTFEFYADMHQEGWNMRDKAREYLDWCKSNAYRPKFDWGINSDYYRAYCEENGYTPNQQIIDMMDADTTNGVWNQYYKFLTDFTAYKPVFNEQGEMIDEIPSPQQRVVTNFDMSEMEKQVIFEGENSMLARREGNIALANQHVSELADKVTPYLNGQITEEEMGLRDDVFYDARKDANAYLEAKGNSLFSTSAQSEPVSEEYVTLFSTRTKPAPTKTQMVYKLMRLGADGRLYPLYIDSAEGIELKVWYDADSPNMGDIENLEVGYAYKIDENGNVVEKKKYNKTAKGSISALPNKEQVNSATNEKSRWIVVDTYADGSKAFYNVGINGSGTSSLFGMRPGWHAGSLPTMRQIGKGAKKNLRDDSFVWVRGYIPADIDYQAEADANSSKDIQTHIPTDGYYLKATNANKKASQADKMGWYIAGSFYADEIISDAEARRVIDGWNAEHPDANVEYDYPRESGKEYDPARGGLVDSNIRFSTNSANFASAITPEVRKEMDVISAQAIVNGSYLKAPNGKDTKLTPEQWALVRTKNFINWFGDWINDPENASKVVDENGEPMVVYHQTNSVVYINRETGENWDELDWRARQEWDERDDWDEYWEEQDFNTFSRVNARTTNELDGFFFAPVYDEYHEYGDRTIPAFLNIKNPASREDYNIDSSRNNAGRDERIRLQNEGFDGVIREEGGEIWEYVAFDPNQIKSATENTGEFSEGEDIRFSTDSRGNVLTPSQQEFFANSKAVDKDGNLLVLYHGTPRAGFTEFKRGWFTTSKEDAISYSGDRKGRLFDPNEEYVPEVLTAGDFRLGYMTFDSEEDRAEFLKRFPIAENVMTEREYEDARMEADDEEYDALTSKLSEYTEIWKAYREYERERLVDSTIGELLENPNAYTEDDFRRALLAYDSNAIFDGIDEMDDAEERKDELIAALNNANEETEDGILDLNIETRVPRNGEGIKHNDTNARTYEVYANIQNPYEVDANGRGSEFVSGDIYKAVEDALADEQYDGVIIRNWRVGRHQQLGDVVVPKNGNQIKLTSNANPTESEDIRFSTRQPNQTAEEFFRKVVNEFKSNYASPAPVKMVTDLSNKESLAKQLGINPEEISDEQMLAIVEGVEKGNYACFMEDWKRILLFVDENVKRSEWIEYVLLHEAVHAVDTKVKGADILGAWLWDNAKGGVLSMCKKNAESQGLEDIKESYREMLAETISFCMEFGMVDELLEVLPNEELRKVVNKIVNKIGYDTRTETEIRRRPDSFQSRVRRRDGIPSLVEGFRQEESLAQNEKSGGNGVLFSTEQRAVETGALRGLATLGSFVPFAEIQRVIDESISEGEKKLSKLVSKGAKNDIEEERIRKAERELSIAKRQRELWDDINSRLIDVTPVKPTTDFSSYDLEAQSPEEFISQMLTMQTTRVNKEGYDEKGNKIIYKVNKKTGIMLTPETLQKELGWSSQDWSKLRYIVSGKEGISIDALAEMISEDKEAQSIFGNMDVMEIKDRILDFLQAVSSYTEIRDYIKNARTRQAEEEADFANARMQEVARQIEEASGMTIDEYNNEIIRESLDEIEAELERLDSSEIYGKFEDLTEEDYGRSLSDVSRREDAGISEGNEAVSESGDVADVSSEETETGASDRDSGRDDSGDVGDREGEAGRDGAPALGDKKSKVVSASIDTSDLSVEEIVKEGKQKVVSANAEAVDAFMDRIRKINGNLQQLRMAAAAQREYDQKTVKAITDLANSLLEGGALNDLTRGEVKRLLGIINGGVGKADLTISFDRLMNLMVANQLRYGQSLIEKFLKIRGSKVNQSGVEARGTLDIPGQQMLNAFKEGIGLTAESLDNKIAEAEDALFSESETERKNSENELVGFYLAKQYQDEISASVEEEKNLKDEIKKADKDYKAGKLTKKEQKELVKSIHDAILENRILRVSAYEKLASNLGAKIVSSIQNAGFLRDAEKERVQRIQHYANSDMQGKPASAHEVAKSKFWNNGLVSIITSPLVTFEQWLRVFGEKSAEGKGYLWNYFMNKWNDANNNEYKGMVEAHKVLDEKVRTVFGGTYTRWSDLFSIEKKMPTVKVEMYDEGEQKEYELSQGNLLYIYMVNKMTDGKMKLAKMGITQDDVDAIVAQMDPRFIQLADWMQGKFLPSLRDKYNAVHERLFGAPMASIDNYFPLKVNQNARVREVDVTAGEGSVKPSTITGSIIKRTKNSLALDVRNADAFDVMLEHIQQMEHWAAFAEFNKDLNTLLSYKKFRNRVQNMSGVFGSGEEAWKNFKESAEIAAGVYKPKTSKADKAMTNIVKGLTSGKINFRLWTAMKQILSMPAFAPYTRLDIFAKNLVSPGSAFEWAMENLPAFEKRWKSREAGNVRLKKTEADWKTWDWMETASRIGMTPNAFVDAVTCAIGAKSVYETKYNQYVKDGYTEAQAEEKAKLDATVAFNATQQSSEAAFLSTIQIDRTFISHLLSVFRNNSFGMQREMVDAVRNMRHRMSEGYKEQSIEFMKKQMIRDGLSEDNAERAAQRIYRNGVFKDAAKIATFGFLMQFLWALGNSAVYMLFGDDDEEKREMLKEAAIRGAFGSIEGLGGGNVIADGLTALATGKIDRFSASFSPAISDIDSLMDEMKRDAVAGASELVNILGQALVGVNPQIIADAAYAIYDACNGDLETSTEAGLLILRLLQAPQSNIDKLFVDEIDFATDKGLDLTIEEFAKRYADYKYKRNAPHTFPFYSDEGERKQEDKYIKRFLRDAEELKRSRGNEEAKKYYDYLDTDYKETTDTINELKRKAKESAMKGDQVGAMEYAKMLDDFMKTDLFKDYVRFGGKAKAIESIRDKMKKVDLQTRESLEDMMLELRREMVEEMEKAND